MVSEILTRNKGGRSVRLAKIKEHLSFYKVIFRKAYQTGWVPQITWPTVRTFHHSLVLEVFCSRSRKQFYLLFCAAVIRCSRAATANERRIWYGSRK